jgi:hypothetical protein
VLIIVGTGTPLSPVDSTLYEPVLPFCPLHPGIFG